MATKQNIYEYSFELRRERRKKVMYVLFVVVSVILSLSLFLHCILFPVRVRSDSMERDIAHNGAVLVCPFLRSPRRGDVVYLSRFDGKKTGLLASAADVLAGFFTAQQYFPLTHTSRLTGKPCLRRVMALPGDSLYMRDYVLYVKPAGKDFYLTEFEVASRPYNLRIYSVPAEWDGVGCAGAIDEMTLGEGEYFVLADNRISATDSRVWGPVPSSRIKGKALIEYFPFNRLRIF